MLFFGGGGGMLKLYQILLKKLTNDVEMNVISDNSRMILGIL